MSNDESLENMLGCSQAQNQQETRKPRPQPEEALKCPRCDSTNTKFCYYNNYSLTQPRYFCKSCRRYWTKGGTLRNVPVGGGCRKNKRSSSSNKRTHQDQSFTSNTTNPLLLTSLPLPSGNFDEHNLSIFGNPTTRNTSCDIFGMNHDSNTLSHGFLNAFRSGFLESHQNNFQNPNYYGYGGDLGDDGSNACGVGVSGEMNMVLPNYDQEELINTTPSQAMAVSTVKQEFCNAREQSENRILWGFPWQFNGDTNMGSEVDSGRASWNTLTSSWHGLLNSPLV